MAYPLEGDTTQAKERAQRPYPFRHFRFALREFPGGGTFGPFTLPRGGPSRTKPVLSNGGRFRHKYRARARGT